MLDQFFVNMSSTPLYRLVSCLNVNFFCSYEISILIVEPCRLTRGPTCGDTFKIIEIFRFLFLGPMCCFHDSNVKPEAISIYQVPKFGSPVCPNARTKKARSARVESRVLYSHPGPGRGGPDD